MITAIVSAIGGPISSVVSGWLGGSGMWWKWPQTLIPTPIGMPSSGVSLGTAGHAKYDVFGRYPFFIVQEWFAEQWPGDKTWACSLCGFKLGFWVKEIGVMGHAAGSEFKAHMDLGTLVPYISPPLIHARLLERIKESKSHLHLRRSTGGNLGGFRNPLMRFSKGALFRVVWFSHHHYLTIRESRWRVCQLALASVKFPC